MTAKKKWKKAVAIIVAVIMMAALVPATTVSAATETVNQSKLTLRYNAEGGIVLKMSSEKKGYWYTLYKAVQVDGKAGTFKKLSSNCNDGDMIAVDWEDYNTKPGNTYYYKVKILDENKKLVRGTNTVKYTIKLEKPYVTAYTEMSTGKPIIKWDKVSGSEKYEIWRATSKKGTYAKVATTQKHYCKHASATAGKTYYYKIKAVSAQNVKSPFSSAVYAKATKADKKLATAVNNTRKKKVTTLKETLSMVSKVSVKKLTYFDGGMEFIGSGKVKFKDVFGSKINDAGAVIYRAEGGYGDAWFAGSNFYPKKNGAKYKTFNVETYGLSIQKMKKGSSNTTNIKNIKKVANTYYSSANWTVTVEKFNASSSKFKGEIRDMAEWYDSCLDKTGYGKYTANKYVLKIKNKKDSSKQGWTFVTVVPTL